MKLSRHFTIAASLLILSALIYAPLADAQLLKKISNGLGKVSNEIEKVEKLTSKGKKEKKEKKKEKKKKDSKAEKAENVSASATEPAPGWKKDYDWRTKTPRPHLTPQTRFLNKKVDFNLLPLISEGIFYIQEYNRSIGYSAYYGFWTIDGKRLFPAIYEGFTKGQPHFDSGACVVKATGTRRHSPVILYADGTTKSLSHEWTNMTQFHDGVAMVLENIDKRVLNIFYINTKGERIWPHLANNNTKSGTVLEMRYIRDGLRAYYSNPDRAWGFLNADGSIAIKPRFLQVRDFHCGYALAIVKGTSGNKAVYIDKKGNVLLELPGDATTLQYAHNLSDISDGYYLKHAGFDNPATFYNLQGEAAKSYPAASAFADGNAFFLAEKYGNDVFVVNSNFDITGRWPFPTSDSEGFQGERITFAEEVPYYTYDRYVTINTAGEPVMWQPKPMLSENMLGQFSPDGFAAAQSEFVDPENPNETIVYTGYIDTEGRYRVVFSENPKAGGPFHSRLPGPEPWEKPIIGDPLPPVDTIPQGPVGGGESSVRYRVSVTPHPAEGGRVFGSGEYAYGDTIRVTGTPEEGWRISYIECDRPSSATSTFNKFVVKGDMHIDCYFTPKDSTEDIGASGIALEGTIPGIGIPVYMQTGNGGTNRYGTPSQGFVAVEADGRFATDKSQKGSLSVNIFFVPMNLRGTEREGDTEFLRLDGGIMQYSGLKVEDNTGWGFFNNPIYEMMMAFDGASQGALRPASYRVEILDGSPEEGRMRLGRMQRLSPKYGWMSADDPSFQLPLGGFFIKRVDKGLGADFFNGVELRTTSPRDVKWEPDAAFYGGNGTFMTRFAAALGEIYRNSVADTPLSNYDMQQFSTDLDNHIFKMRP